MRALSLIVLCGGILACLRAPSLGAGSSGGAGGTADEPVAVMDEIEPRPELEAVSEWNATSAEAVVRPYAERSGLKLGAVAQPLRAALTGRTTSPPIFDVLAVLGRDESLARLRDQAAP